MSGEARKGSPAASNACDGDARDLQPATRAAAWNALNTIFMRLSSVAIAAVVLRLISPSDFRVWGARWAPLVSTHFTSAVRCGLRSRAAHYYWKRTGL